MCVKVCVVFIGLTFGFGILSLCLVLLTTPVLIVVVHDRSYLLDNQFQLFDAWAKQPLREKHKFYFFNITGGDRFLRSDDTPMAVDEVGPFVYTSLDSNQTVGPDGYNLTSLSLENLRFNLDESTRDESLSLYALNIPLIRRLSSEPHFLSPEESLVSKTTVREILRDIVDGLNISWVESFLGQYVSKELGKDSSSSYLQYLRNEMCLRLFRVVRFLNPSTTVESDRFFRKLPCDCLAVVPNGTERMDREDQKYRDVLTSKYRVLWDDEHCANSSGDPSIRIQQNLYVTKNLFSVSSAAYWRNDTFVQYDHQMGNSGETRIKVEQFSDVITDFSFEYQLNIPIKLRRGKNLCGRVNHYPILRIVTSGVSVEDVDSSIYRYIMQPERITRQWKSTVLFCTVCFLTFFWAAIILWAYRRIRTGIAELTQ